MGVGVKEDTCSRLLDRKYLVRAAGAASQQDGGLDEEREEDVALELILDVGPADNAEVLRPLWVDLAVKVKERLL